MCRDTARRSLVTHDITDKAVYLSKVTKLRLLFLPLSLVSSCNQSRMNVIPALFHMMMQFTFKLVPNHLWKWIGWKHIQSELQLMHIQCECKQCKLIRFQCTLFHSVNTPLYNSRCMRLRLMSLSQQCGNFLISLGTSWYAKQKHLACKKGEANQKQQSSDYACD